MKVGLDWASEIHHVTVIDDAGGIVDSFQVEHTEEGLCRALQRLRKHAVPSELAVAIERPSGLVVERLLEAGHPVVPIHPNAFSAARPRWGASRAKSDPKDSYCLADFLRTDGHRFRVIKPLSGGAEGLRALCRLRDDHVKAKVAATNQLASLLDAHWPGAARIFGRLDSVIALAFLTDYPTPKSATRLGESRLTMFCHRHSYCGRRSPTELLQRLRDAPVAPTIVAPETLAQLVSAQVRLLTSLLATIADLDSALGRALLTDPKASLLKHLPRIGKVNLAQVVAEVGPVLERSADCDHACAEVGAAPVTKKSGKSEAVNFRWAANTKARKALATFADNSRHASPWAADLYKQARARGKRHPHAIRILMRAWMRVLWACWHKELAYDPKNHGGEVRIAKQLPENPAA